MSDISQAVMEELAGFVGGGSGLPAAVVSQALGAFTLIGLRHNVSDEIGAVVMLNGAEIHLFIRPAFRGWFMTPKKIRVVLDAVQAELGFVTTRVRLADADKIALVKRFRFAPTWSDGIYQFFMYTGRKQ